jgi:hypothetical protein
MKKIVMMIAAMMTMTIASATNDGDDKVLDTKAYDMTVNMRKLAVVLDLNMDQMEAVQDIHHQFCNEMAMAAMAKSEDREVMVENAVRKDIRYMHYVLDEKQYKKYLLLLNTTLSNRGLR